MFSIFYLILVILFGISIIIKYVNIESIFNVIAKEEFSKKIPKSLFIIPSGICVGMMTVSFLNYFIIYIINWIIKNNTIAYSLGIGITSVFFSVLTIFNFKKIKNNKKEKNKYKKVDLIYFILICLGIISLVSFIMIYTYRTKENNILISSGTYSDLVIHTSITSSFGVGGNIPTNYTYFSGDGINWHFFFYFFSGILNYLGMPVVWAINVSSIITMSSALILLGLLASIIAKNKIAFILSPLFVFFRSALNIFYEGAKLIENKKSLMYLFKRTEWSNIEAYGNWGFGTLNIYSNQRHFMIGMSAILILTILFLPYVIELIDELKKHKKIEKIKYFLFSKDVWKFDTRDKRIIIASLIIITLPYFHGSALISSLLILAIFAIFSKNRLSYLSIAIIAVISSIIQTKFFSGDASNVVKMQFEYGYILGQVSLKEIIKYLFITTGYIGIICLILLIKHKKDLLLYLVLFMSFISSMIFAFMFKVSVEMQNNHKFVQFSTILLTILISEFVADVINNKIKAKDIKIISIFLGVCFTIILTSTGIMDFCTFLNRNKNTVTLNPKSELVEWIKVNTETDDVFLTPLWIGNNFFLSGRSTFLGYKYYAWTAGYDTETREKEYKSLLTGVNNNKEEFVELCQKHNIKYVIEQAEIYNLKDTETKVPIYNSKFIKENFELVKQISKDNIKIYKIY